MKERAILMTFSEQRSVEMFTVALSCDMLRLTSLIKVFSHPVNTDYLMLQQYWVFII